jgi:arachidonate 15-lipoxygenase
MSDALHFRDLPTLEWTVKVAKQLLIVIANTVEVDTDSSCASEFEAKIKTLKRELESGHVGFATLREVVSDVIEWGRLRNGSGDRPKSIDDYTSLFKAIGLPAIAKDYDQDSVFAAMRTSGPNPVMIELVTEPIHGFPLTEAGYQRVMPGDTLDAAIKQRPSVQMRLQRPQDSWRA